MPVSVEKLYRPEKMHMVFAVASVLLLLTTFWFISVDYDRHWREYQKEYQVSVAALAHLDYLQTQTAAAQAELAAAHEAAEAEAAKLAEPAAATLLAETEVELARAQFEAIQVEQDFAKGDQLLQVARADFEKILTKHGEDHPKTIAARKALDRDAAEVEVLRIKSEQLGDDSAVLDRAIRDMREPSRVAQKAYDDLFKVAEDAQRKDRQYRGLMPEPGLLGDLPLVGFLINAPLADFAAPKGTPAHQEIKQLVLPDVRQRLNYLESYTTDRCITCHLAVDNRDFSIENLAARLERSLPAVDEELARRGLKPLELPAPPELDGDDAPTLHAGQVTDHWDRLNEDQQEQYFDELLTRVNAYFREVGYRELTLDEPLRAHPDLELFVDIDSPHPMARMGCTVCHEGNPQETEFVLAAHTPESHDQEHEWAEKHYVTQAGVPNFTFKLVAHYWDRPMLLGKYTEGSCVKCHSQVTEIGSFDGEPVGRNINLGYNLFINTGCINCHKVDGLEDSRRVGPDLTRVASKLSPGFTEQWIFNPRSFRPSTWMPHFFMQENNGPGSENEFDQQPVLRTKVEVQAMAAYLQALSVPWEPESIPDRLTGDVERGRSLLQETGCLACHANIHEFGQERITANMQHRLGKTASQSEADYQAMTYNDRVQYAWDHFASDRDAVFHPDRVRFDPEADYHRPIFTRFGPELSAVGSKASVEWLYAWLRDPHAYAPDTKMPSLRLTEQESLDIATYLKSLEHDTFDDRPLATDEQSQAMADRLVFELLTAQRSEARSHAVMKDEGGELTRLLKSVVAKSDNSAHAQARIEELDVARKKMVFLGNKMISHYGCYACHLITGFEEATRPGTDLTEWTEKPIGQLDFAFYDHAFDDLREEDPEVFGKLYPPERDDLIRLAHGDEGGNPDEEITATHSAFAYHKMRNPRIWDRSKIKRPYDKLKMPNYYFSEREADALVTFLMGRRPPRVTSNLKVDYDGSPLGKIAAGRKLARELNCVGCHRIEDNVATLHQYFRVPEAGELRFDEDNAPPYLRGEGAKVQHSWLYGFLQNVETLRPWLKVRMPSFDLTNEQATILVEYFAGMSGYEAEQLEKNLDEVHKFVTESEKAGDGPTGSTMDSGTDWFAQAQLKDWFAQAQLKDETAFLTDYAIENRLVNKYDLNPDETEFDDLVAAHAQVVNTARFIKILYDIPYPFVDAPRPLVAEDRFTTGEELLYELNCLKCHALGDPDVEGANKNPTAPNLNLTFRRLRQEWFRNWLKSPAWIQAGTKMPQLFPDANSAFVDYGDLRADLEAKFGATGEEQIELLLDFIYNAGLTNFTGVQPGGVAGPAADKGDDEFFEEDEEFFDDE